MNYYNKLPNFTTGISMSSKSARYTSVSGKTGEQVSRHESWPSHAYGSKQGKRSRYKSYYANCYLSLGLTGKISI